LLCCSCCNVLQCVKVCCRVLQWCINVHIVRLCGGMEGVLTHHCNTLQHTATHCNTLQQTATHLNLLQHILFQRGADMANHAVLVVVCVLQMCECFPVRCSVLQFVAVYCDVLQSVAMQVLVVVWCECVTCFAWGWGGRGVEARSRILDTSFDIHIQHNTLQHTATHCNILQYTATHCNNTLQQISGV